MRIRYLIMLSVSLRAAIVVACFSFLIFGNFVIGTIWFRSITPETDLEKTIKNIKNLNAFDDVGYTGLMYAAVFNFPYLAQALLSAGADVNIVSKKQYNNTAMHFAIKGGDQTISIAQLYLDNNANLLLQNSDLGATPLLMSFFISDYEKRKTMIQRLIKHGGSINAQYSTDGNTLLHYMVENRDLTFIKIMLDYFGSLIDFGMKNDKGDTAYQWAQSFYYTDVVEVLSQLPSPLVEPGKVDKNGLTTLMIWVMRGDMTFVERLIQEGAQIEARSEDEYKYSALQLAVLYENIPMVKMLMSNKANVMGSDAQGRIPLMHIERIVSPMKRKEMAQQLLSVKAQEQLSHKDAYGSTVLFYLVVGNDIGLIRYLIDNYRKWIDFKVKNNALQTAYDIAVRLKRVEIEKLLKPYTLEDK